MLDGGAPHFAQQAVVDALRFSCPASGSRNGSRRCTISDLLIAVEAAGEASPEDPPVDFVLHLIGEVRAAGVDAAHLLDAEFVADVAEAGAQTEAAEIQPADFVSGAAFALFDLFEEDVGQAAGDIDGPGIASQAERGFEARGQFFGRDCRPSTKAARTSVAGGIHGFLADHGGGAARDGSGRCGGLAQLELQTPAVLADLRIAPGFERADFGEPRAEFHGNQAFAAFAEANDGFERRVLVKLFSGAELHHFAGLDRRCG